MKKTLNYFLLLLVAGIVSFSFLFLACLSAPISLQRYENTYYFILHQFIAGLLPAIVLGVVAYKVPVGYWKKWSPWLVAGNIVALFLVFLPVIGSNAGGATRWLDFKFFTVQPSEFLKITAVLYLSAWIASKLSDEKVAGWKSITQKNYHDILYIFFPFVIFMGFIAAALFLQRDASTMGIITLTLLALYFSARTPLWHTLVVVMGGVSFLLFMVKFEPYRLDRWLIFLHPDTDPLGKGFQLRQSLISLGSGGVFGRGLGMSIQKFGYLPQAISDSIFAIIGEEFGMLGSLLLVAAFVLFLWFGIQISKNSHDRFSKMAAIGIVTWITLQAFVNMASVAGIFPLAGIPLPFFSYGGSHLAVELFGVGLLLNISKNT